MANVNLKTDFKDGEFLYADQLKNNFEAIQAALNTMNAIVWQDNADKVVTFRGTTEELMNREIIDGQILYDTTTGESYIDYKGKRISTGSGNAIHIGDTEPTNPSTQIWINDDELSAVGSEVVNSLDGNEERMAPSVAAVNKFLTALGDSYGYVVPKVDGDISKGGWTALGEDFETAEIPAGEYLLLYACVLTGKEDQLGLSTLNPYIDGERTSNTTRQSIPILKSYATSGQCIFRVKFEETKKHIVNLYQYSNQDLNVTTVNVFFYRIG